MRWIEDDGRVTVFRNPSGYSNGNTFDYEGRQLSCEHGGRRVVRYEPNGTRDRHRREVSGQAPELAERHRRASRTAASGSPIRPTASAATTKGSKASRRPRKRSIASTARAGRSTRSPMKPAQPERHLLLARLQEALRRRHRHAARHHGLGRRRQDAPQRQALHPARHSRHRRAVGGRRHPLRRGRQHLGGRAAGRSGDRAERRAHRHDPAARDVRERLLRRRETQPPVHDRQPVALRRSYVLTPPARTWREGPPFSAFRKRGTALKAVPTKDGGYESKTAQGSQGTALRAPTAVSARWPAVTVTVTSFAATRMPSSA